MSRTKKTYKALASAFDCEIVAVEVEYKMSYLDGSELSEIKQERLSFEDALKEILKGVL
ncbi:TPA: hypothetical protein ACHVAK_001126 [Streptococcus suis]